jgi:predicted dehydrogenase
MNYGVIGTGMIAGIHAKAIAAMSGGSLHSVYKHRTEGAERFAAEHGIRAFSDLAAFLADPALDVVTVCTPSGAHFELPLQPGCGCFQSRHECGPLRQAHLRLLLREMV